MKYIFILVITFLHYTLSQLLTRRYIFDRTYDPLTRADFPRLQIWDELDIVLGEQAKQGGMWVIDPVAHTNDAFFSVINH